MAARPSPDTTPLAPPKACILVVEDDDEHRALVTRILEGDGYSAEGVAQGQLALGRMQHEPLPDLLVVDLKMPVMDGWHLVAEMKAEPALAAIPVVVMSGGGERVLSSAPVSAGYLEKPIDPARLLETVAACLVRKELRSSGRRPVGG